MPGMSDFTEITSGLRFPEGPIAMPDGSVILVEMFGPRITRVLPDGSKQTVAEIVGGPNGAAIGPDGALYLFPKLDVEKFHIVDDEKFALDLLKEQKILVSHGRAFNWPEPDHFRLVTLPSVEMLATALDRIEEFLSNYRQ
jgi:sugar lactone lactonase YvrE